MLVINIYIFYFKICNILLYFYHLFILIYNIHEENDKKNYYVHKIFYN